MTSAILPSATITEEILNELALSTEEVNDGFEGNAQSFRIVTKLELRESIANVFGLDLTRATLHALLKYP